MGKYTQDQIESMTVSEFRDLALRLDLELGMAVDDLIDEVIEKAAE